MKKYIISLDGGGTKSEAIAYELDGTIIGHGYSGFSNILINEQDAIKHIIEAIENCLCNLEKKDCLFLYLGLAGYGGVKDRKHVEKALFDRFHIPFKIVNDAQIAHAALLDGKDGVLTIAGTGSVSLGSNLNRFVTTGGWGHLLGDEGSGYWISMEVFKKITREFDEDLPLSNLSRKLLNRLKLNEIDEIKRYIYHETKGEIASNVPFIVEEAVMGDLFAKEVLERAGQLLANITLQAIKKSSLHSSPRVAIKGSILQQVSFVQNAFVDAIRDMHPTVEFCMKDVSSTYGGYLLALKEIQKRSLSNS